MASNSYSNITHASNTTRLLKLIEAVKKRPCLWHLKDENYGTKASKDPIWKEIGKESGYGGYEAKATWKKLRDIHRDSVKRRKNKLLQPWKFSVQMDFLLPHMKKRSLEKGDEVYRVYETDNGERVGLNKRLRSEPSHADVTEAGSKNKDLGDPLKSFFDTMHNTTKKLPGLLQLEIKRKIFEVVSDAEEKYLRNNEDKNLRNNEENCLRNVEEIEEPEEEEPEVILDPDDLDIKIETDDHDDYII